MHDFRNNRKKKLDLVICTPRQGESFGNTFASLGTGFGVQLTPEQSEQLNDLPSLRQCGVGSVLLALEAKACMTEHIKARPRLYDELSSSYQTVLGDTKSAIAAALIPINIAETFVSPSRNKRRLKGRKAEVSRHKQPKVAFDVLNKMKELPRRSNEDEAGFDAIGVCMVECKNDGSPVNVVQAFPEGSRLDPILRYDSMVDRIAHWYATRFRSI